MFYDNFASFSSNHLILSYLDFLVLLAYGVLCLEPQPIDHIKYSVSNAIVYTHVRIYLYLFLKPKKKKKICLFIYLYVSTLIFSILVFRILLNVMIHINNNNNNNKTPEEGGGWLLIIKGRPRWYII